MTFFEETVILLAQRLQATGVFSQNDEGNECLDFALRNPREWEHRGVALVEEHQEMFKQLLQGHNTSSASRLQRLDM